MNTNDTRSKVESQILAALAHEEAEDGLYLRNFNLLGEEDERPAVEADEFTILEILTDLIRNGQVTCDETHHETIFHLNRSPGPMHTN